MTAFGGPAAHIAMMHDEVVRRRAWVTDKRFVDLVGATNLIPGPNSTELAIHLGWERARGRGLVAAGVCFIAPAALIVGALAWVYLTYGDTPTLEGVLYGIKPVVIAIVAQALAKLLPIVAKTHLLAVVAAGAVATYLLGVNELIVLAAGGATAAGLRATRHVRDRLLSVWLSLAAVATDVDLGRLFLTFLRIGAVLYGSGYVLLAFLQGELVERLGWITSQQLLDAVSIGQVTPGPVFTTATFIGYITAGLWGAVLATIGTFLPSFIFVALLTRLVDWMRASPPSAPPSTASTPPPSDSWPASAPNSPATRSSPPHHRHPRRRRTSPMAHPTQLRLAHNRRRRHRNDPHHHHLTPPDITTGCSRWLPPSHLATRTSPPFDHATTDGVVRHPSALG